MYNIQKMYNIKIHYQLIHLIALIQLSKYAFYKYIFKLILRFLSENLQFIQVYKKPIPIPSLMINAYL